MSGQPDILRMHHSLGISRSHQVIRNWTNVWVHTRCGRVMADNIAYAKFRKNLLI